MKLLHNIRTWLANPEPEYATRGDDSDIEIRETTQGYIECVDCPLPRYYGGFYGTWDEAEMADHVREHKSAGHAVPVTTIPNLLR